MEGGEVIRAIEGLLAHKWYRCEIHIHYDVIYTLLSQLAHVF